MIKDPLEGTHFAGGGRVGFRNKAWGQTPATVPDTNMTPPAGSENVGTDLGAPPQNPVAIPDGGSDDSGSWSGGDGWGGNPVQMGYLGNSRGGDWSRGKGSATSDWRGGSGSLDRNTGGSFIGDWTGGAIGRQTTGQGINSGLQDLGWGLKSYGEFANIDTPLGSFGVLPGQGLAKVAGNQLLDWQIDAIDASFNALPETVGGGMDGDFGITGQGGAAVPGADLEGDDTVTVSDAQGNVRTFGNRQYAAIQDLQKNDWEASRVGRREDVNGNTVNFNVTPENQLSGANSSWESDSYGDRNEAEAVASSGWGSDAHFDAIDAQFDDNDSSDSGGGK